MPKTIFDLFQQSPNPSQCHHGAVKAIHNKTYLRQIFGYLDQSGTQGQYNNLAGSPGHADFFERM